MQEDIRKTLNSFIEDFFNKNVFNGIWFYGTELVGSVSQSILRVYIDKEGGVSIEDCVFISKLLDEPMEAFIDTEKLLAGAYTVEVSSPGLNRPLFTPEHFKNNLKAKIKMKAKEKIENQQHFKGILNNIFEDNSVEIIIDEKKTVKIAFENILKTNLLSDIDGE